MSLGGPREAEVLIGSKLLVHSSGSIIYQVQYKPSLVADLKHFSLPEQEVFGPRTLPALCR